MKPFVGRSLGSPKNGVLSFMAILTFATFATTFCLVPPALAGDGATEALALRVEAEHAIAQERAAGNPRLAGAMQEALAGLLQEYLTARDGTVALDTVDAAYVQEQWQAARAAEEPGVALALDVFAGPGTGFEHEMQAKMAGLASFEEPMGSRVSDAALDAHERVMERQLEKVDGQVAKLEAKLDAVAERFEVKAEAKAEKAEAKAEAKAEKAEEKAEAKADKAEEKAEKQAEAEEKADKGGKK